MNQLDLAFLVGCLLAALGGFRLGLIRRVTGWIGLVLALVLVSRFLPSIVSTTATPAPADLLKSLGVLFVGGGIGQALGMAAGSKLKKLIDFTHLRILDAVLGSVLGVVGVLVAAWMIIPAMTQIPGWPAEAARGSQVAGRLTRALGDPPDVLAGVSKSLGVSGLSDALQGARDLNLDPSAPSKQPVPSEVLSRVQASVVKLSGPACERQQSGSGFVIAPGIVATNAHVVAGTESTTITNDDGLKVDGTVRYLDIRNDIALVVAPDLDRPALPLVEAGKDATGSILGYPGGGPLKIQPYTIAASTVATSQDIYDTGSFQRKILILGSRIQPGDSGGPLIDPAGQVAGIAFGIAPDDDQTAYAIPAALLGDLVTRISAEPIGTGACRGD